MTPRGETAPEDPRLRAARRAVNLRTGFSIHLVVYVCVCCLLSVVATPFVGAVVALAWGVGLALHGFITVALGPLRRKWSEEALRDAPGPALPVAAPSRHAASPRHARDLEALSAGIAHELRNPITAAKSLVAQLAEDPQSPDAKEYARVAVEELDRAERSIAHLLRYAREEALSPRETTLGAVLDSALEPLKERAERLGAELRREDPEPPCALRADPEKLRRVVLNLVGNALDALEAAGTASPRVELSLGTNLAGTSAWLRVRDNGPGVPEGERERLFTVFHSTRKEGTGLGLALSRKLVEAHGGTLECVPPSGPGAEFVVTLPVEGP
ncbi:MAG: HAMP domain-containing histidine kinase [Deltaproteobacteria bacterium]|nr:HAMP domain-containing histidine kinase [Deltaproteobacteria bacterium]